MVRRRLLVILASGSLLLSSASLGAGPIRAATGTVTVDLSLGNEIATGAVTDPDPAHARVTVSNRYHFWAGLDLQAPSGGARLTPTPIGEDARGLYGLLGLIGPEATSAWAGTFDPAGGSQAVWLHYDLATARGAQALALTTLTIVADSFGAPLLAPSASAVVHAVTLLTDLDEFTNLLAAVGRNDPWEIAKAWSLLLQSQAGRDAIRLALADLGVVATDGALKSLGSVVGLIDFARTMLDLLRAGLAGHTSGLVTFSVGGEPEGSRQAPPSATSAPSQAGTGRVYQGVFVPTGSMSVARDSPSATLLPDGRVLVVGGLDAAGTPLASAELYDPRTGTFSPTGSMSVARDYPSATLLPDGRVLVVGGFDASAELYDPRTGTFSPTGSMSVARSSPSTTLFPDGRVLVVGGQGPVSSLASFASAELYDPRTGTFSPTGSMSVARGSPSVTLLSDGRVLVVGGQSAGGTSLASAELYDPRTGTFSPTGSMSLARSWLSATLLSDGRVLVVGGERTGAALLSLFASAELYDPRTGTFSPTGSMSVARSSPSAALLPDGRVLVVGGLDAGGTPLTSAELYDPRTGTFSPTGSMSVGRNSPSTTLLPDGRVLVVARAWDETPLASAELFR